MVPVLLATGTGQRQAQRPSEDHQLRLVLASSHPFGLHKHREGKEGCAARDPSPFSLLLGGSSKAFRVKAEAEVEGRMLLLNGAMETLLPQAERWSESAFGVQK